MHTKLDINTDVDECELQLHNCHANASCINTISSFQCVCKPSYEGDGINCFGEENLKPLALWHTSTVVDSRT